MASLARTTQIYLGDYLDYTMVLLIRIADPRPHDAIVPHELVFAALSKEDLVVELEHDPSRPCGNNRELEPSGHVTHCPQIRNLSSSLDNHQPFRTSSGSCLGNTGSAI